MAVYVWSCRPICLAVSVIYVSLSRCIIVPLTIQWFCLHLSESTPYHVAQLGAGLGRVSFVQHLFVMAGKQLLVPRSILVLCRSLSY